MAIMYPEKPKQFNRLSREDIMFDALSKLPDTYYVFHSFSIVNVIEETAYESETDFVIFHPKKGILCLEAKAGAVKYENGCWKYGSGIEMSHDGPFHQASSNKWKLMNYMKQHNLERIVARCKMLHGVWFPSISKDHFKGVKLPSEADTRLMLTEESIDNIEQDIEEIFRVKVPSEIETNISIAEANQIINEVLAPSFNLISLPEMEMNQRKQVFKIMLKEQVSLLNYLEDQNTAVINGMAGTGKTVIAIEKARRHSEKGDDVLFLCYNVYLKEHLQKIYPYENVHYYTIDGLACKLCNTVVPDYPLLRDKLYEYYENGDFPYKHLIIDEGQDFGQDRIDDEEIISLMRDNVIDRKEGSFYLFYDKNQMVQAKKLPDYIDNADCKLTLYKNCRNTFNIATTSLRFLGSEKNPKLFDGAIKGDLTQMTTATSISETVRQVNAILDECKEKQYKDIVLLTCKTEDSSCLSQECNGGVYTYNKMKIPFTTCRKFKGLEADAVIITDLDKSTLENDDLRIMYVGTSRARFKLYLIANLSDEDCRNFLVNTVGRSKRKPAKEIAALFNSKYAIL